MGARPDGAEDGSVHPTPVPTSAELVGPVCETGCEGLALVFLAARAARPVERG